MAATIIRLKRRLNDDSVDSFILNTKRRKIDSVKSDNDLSTIFNFVGTGKSPEDVLEHIKKPPQSKVNLETKLDTLNVLKKLKDEWKKNSKSDRFKVVNSFRFSEDTEEASSADAKCTIVDVESNNKDIASDAPTTSEQFVYDFYTTNDLRKLDEELYEDALDNVLSVCPVNMEIFHSRCQDNDDTDDSDDSNAENYYGNDYPDESEASDEECDDYDEDDEESKQFRKAFREANLDDHTFYIDSEEDDDLTRSDCDEYDGTCTP